MARRRRHRLERHGPDWHEAQLAQPWLNYSVLDEDGRPVRPLTEAEYEKGVRGKQQQMQMHDMQPKRMRELVAEHNVRKGQELYALELRTTTAKCPHGRYGPSCAQCTYDRAQAAVRAQRETSGGLPVAGRNGEELTRTARTGTVADIIARRGKWRD